MYKYTHTYIYNFCYIYIYVNFHSADIIVMTLCMKKHCPKIYETNVFKMSLNLYFFLQKVFKGNLKISVEHLSRHNIYGQCLQVLV